MDIRLLRSFEAAARSETFSAAARELSLSQPALTKQIQALERQAGAVLFLRGRHGARLTDQGRQLLADAQDVLSRLDAFDRRLARLAGGAEGVLTLGFGLSGIDRAPRAVATFRARYPGVSVTLDDLPSTVQLERVAAGSLHAGFVRLPAPAQLARVVVGEDTLAVATPSGTPEPPQRRAALRDWLDRRPLVRLTTPRGPGLAGQITRLYDDLGCAPVVVQEARDLQTVLALVAAGVGDAVLPASAAGIVPPGVRLTAIPLRTARWQLGLVWHPGVPNPNVERFVAVVRADLPGDSTGPARSSGR
ncbi:MAG TPA: LysR family transcriptional regulator [Kribbellaceae bacterium]|nr:LysR family transcriptional regulator [Kribbellaceae bacterium]